MRNGSRVSAGRPRRVRDASRCVPARRHQPVVRLWARRLARRREATDPPPVRPFDRLRQPPRVHHRRHLRGRGGARSATAHETRVAAGRGGAAAHQPEHGHSRLLDKLREEPIGGRAVEEGDGGAVEERGVQQPRAHHPAEVGRPAHDVALADVVVGEGVGAAADRRHVTPRDRLRVSGGARREEDVRDVVGGAHVRRAVAVLLRPQLASAHEVGPRLVAVAAVGEVRRRRQRAAVVRAGRHDDAPLHAALDDPRVHVLGREDRLRLRDAHARRNLARRERLGDADGDAAGEDEAEVDAD